MTDFADSPEPPPSPAHHGRTVPAREQAGQGAPGDARPGVPDFEPRSSVKITVNSKGDRQWEIKVVAAAETEDAVRSAALLAKQIDQQFVSDYGLPGGGKR